MPPIQAGNECRSDCGPRPELRTEFAAQEFLLGRNDSLVVKPEREQECDQKQQVSGGHYQPSHIRKVPKYSGLRVVEFIPLVLSTLATC